MPVLLASGSPQRRAILEQLEIPFRIVVPDVDELVDGEPRQTAIRNSRLKAQAALNVAADDELIVAVDTVVSLDGTLFGKPTDEAQARSMLGALRGRTHTVVSGLTLLHGSDEHTLAATTEVRFREFDAKELDRYLRSGEWRERAGGYAIQGQGAALVSSVAGDFYNVVGFPVAGFLDLIGELSLGGFVGRSV